VIAADVINAFKGDWVNIHGGILPKYRGLDSHLWAASRQDWMSIGVTAHFLTEDLDCGPKIISAPLKNAHGKGWLSLNCGIRKLENQVHSRLLKEWPMKEIGGPSVVEPGEYFGAFPRYLGLIPIYKVGKS